MAIATTPELRPANPDFSSGPCAKRPGFTLDALGGALLGRSHRAKGPKARLAEVIDRSRAILGCRQDWRLGIVPASDTGAMEMALWSLLGARPVDILAFESFSEGWATDVVKQLRLDDALVLKAPYGALPDLGQVDMAHDIVLAWNGTTSGVRIPDGDWIAADRAGLVICDATSAAFAMDLPWEKLDVVTWSWQKVLGGEAAHGMLALSPRAVERLLTHKPAWPLPKIFRLTSGGKLAEGVFRGETINTPSMLCVEDALDGLRWAEQAWRAARPDRAQRGQSGRRRCLGGAQRLGGFPGRGCGDTQFHLDLPEDHRLLVHRARCGGAGRGGEADRRPAGEARVAYDIASYRDAPPGLRIWGGATVESSDIAALLPWLDWAHAAVKAEFAGRTSGAAE